MNKNINNYFCSKCIDKLIKSSCEPFSKYFLLNFSYINHATFTKNS